VNRATRVHDDAILSRAFAVVRHDHAVHLHVQVLTRAGIDQPRLTLAVFLVIKGRNVRDYFVGKRFSKMTKQNVITAFIDSLCKAAVRLPRHPPLAVCI